MDRFAEVFRTKQTAEYVAEQINASVAEAASVRIAVTAGHPIEAHFSGEGAGVVRIGETAAGDTIVISLGEEATRPLRHATVAIMRQSPD